MDATCPHCGHGQAYEITTRNRFKCKRCLKQFSTKSASPYRAAKLPLKKIEAITTHLLNQPDATVASIMRKFKLSHRGAYYIVARICEKKQAIRIIALESISSYNL